MKKIIKSQILRYILLTFGIAWSSELLIIIIERLNLFNNTIEKIIDMIIIAIGPGLAPAYSTYIIKKKDKLVTGMRDFIRSFKGKRGLFFTIIVMGIFCLYQTFKCAILENYLGYPIYFFIIMIPLMIVGGGLEEIGWKGFFQELIEKKMNFYISCLLLGIIWAIWHIPLWFIQTSSQSSFNFISFMLYCITFSYSLGLLYKITKSTWAVIFLHAWGNVLFGGMFTYKILVNAPNIKVICIYIIEIFTTSIIAFIYNKIKSTKTLYD